MKKIKILETIRQGSVGGGETYLYNLVSNLDTDKFQVEVLSFTDGEMIDKLKKIGIKTHIIPTEKPFDFSVYPLVKKLISENDFDIVHAHGTRAGTNSIIPAKLLKKKILYTVHGWSFHTGNNPLVTLSRKLSERLLVSLCNTVICGSQSDVNSGRKYCGGKSYELIHNSIDTKKFNPDSEWKNLRDEFGFSEQDIIVSFVARMTFQKDPLTFIRAIPIVASKCPNVKFLVVGDGELKREVIQLAKALNVTDKIVFTPFRSDVQNIHHSVNVFVLPSLWEVIPLALLEAMSMRVACIATNINGTTEALEHDKNGLLFECGSESELADRIINLATDSKFRERLGVQARATVESKFDLAKLVHRNEEVYSKISGQKA